MAEGVFITLGAWALALLLYPGVLFAAALSLVGEWLAANMRLVFIPRINRTPIARRAFLQPAYDALKTAGRLAPDALPVPATARPSTSAALLVAAALAAPVLAILLMPLPGNPLVVHGGGAFDIFVVLCLLVVQPLLVACSKLSSGGIATLHGGQDLGRLLTGLLPGLLCVAALTEVSAGRSLGVGSLVAAPETAPQTIVRLAAGAVLLLVLPWWTGSYSSRPGVEQPDMTLGGLFQRVALAAFWTVLVLPLPGDLPWAVAVLLVGMLAAYTVMRLLPGWLTQGRGEAGAAGLVTSVAVPVAVAALLLALWSGA